VLDEGRETKVDAKDGSMDLPALYEDAEVVEQVKLWFEQLRAELETEASIEWLVEKGAAMVRQGFAPTLKMIEAAHKRDVVANKALMRAAGEMLDKGQMPDAMLVG
jgi:hypothetical protein